MATSKLQREVGALLDKTFPQFRIRENYRPEWLASSNLTKLELDFYIEELKMAFEIQGEQHYGFIPFFHKTQDDFEKRKRYDAEKKDLCRGAGVKLIEVCSYMDALMEIEKIDRSHPVFDQFKAKHEASIESSYYLPSDKDLRNRRKMKAKVGACNEAREKLVSAYGGRGLSKEETKDLLVWRSKALSWNKQGKGNAVDWSNEYLREEIAAPIRAMLKRAKTQGDIAKIFDDL